MCALKVYFQSVFMFHIIKPTLFIDVPVCVLGLHLLLINGDITHTFLAFGFYFF